MNELTTIGRAANMLCVSVETLRNWDKSGRLRPAYKTVGGHRRYRLSDVEELRAGYVSCLFHEDEAGERLTADIPRVSDR